MTSGEGDPVLEASYSRWFDWFHAALVRTAPLASGGGPIGRLWHRAWGWLARREGLVVRSSLFGSPVRLPARAVYGVYARRWPSYNMPIVELAHQMARSRGRPIAVVDVGAAMGDTALLLRARCGSEVGEILSVEGDSMHAAFLRHNLQEVDGTLILEAMLSDSYVAPELVRNPVGTAIAAGPNTVTALPLDDVLEERGFVPDLIKIDTDGFDGRVLAGAARTLRQHAPAVLFEWDPGSFIRTESDPHQPFLVCSTSGYEDFVWYTKYGEFSHFMRGYDELLVEAHMRFCLDTTSRVEWHYDVIALPAGSQLDRTALADLRFVTHGR